MSSIAVAGSSSNDIECVLISDEEDDEAARVSGSARASNSAPIEKNPLELDRSSDDNDGRRFSRRRKTRNEPDSVKTEGETAKPQNSSQFGSSSLGDKKINVETRSRKRERSLSPPSVDVKETEPHQYILPGLEGAAFSSR